MRTIIFNTHIDEETIDALIRDIETIDPNEGISEIVFEGEDGQETKVQMYKRKIYFSTEGGSLSAARILIDFINNHDYFFFEVIANEQLSSAGFETFIRLNCSKSIMDTTFSFIHRATTDLDLRESLKKKSVQKDMLKRINMLVEDQLKYYKEIGIDDKIIRKIKAGEDVLLLYPDLKKLFNLNEMNQI
jgi:hypothetical protein